MSRILDCFIPKCICNSCGFNSIFDKVRYMNPIVYYKFSEYGITISNQRIGTEIDNTIPLTAAKNIHTAFMTFIKED